MIEDIAEEINENSSGAEVRERVERLASESATVHCTFSDALHDVYTCKHGNWTIADWICNKRSSKVGRYLDVVMFQNCVLGKLVRDSCGQVVIIQYSAGWLPPPFRTLSRVVHKKMEGYLKSIASKLPVSSISF